MANRSSNPHVVDVYIRDPKITNPKSIAEKYNLDYDPSDNENEEDGEDVNGEGHEEDSLEDGRGGGRYSEERLAQEISEHHGVQNKVNDLVKKLDAKNREIERLCVLLEAVSVVPGADPGKFIEMIDGKEEIVVCLPSLGPLSLHSLCLV